MKDTLKIAQKLALEFSEESDIPSRFKKEVKKKYNEDSLIEQRFQKNVMNWKQVVDTMLQKIGSEKTSRFILLKPIIEPNLQSVVYAQDFIDFNNYFILRRDVEQCNDNEVGCLAMLSMAFQRKIEQHITKPI